MVHICFVDAPATDISLIEVVNNMNNDVRIGHSIVCANVCNDDKLDASITLDPMLTFNQIYMYNYTVGCFESTSNFVLFNMHVVASDPVDSLNKIYNCNSCNCPNIVLVYDQHYMESFYELFKMLSELTSNDKMDIDNITNYIGILGHFVSVQYKDKIINIYDVIVNKYNDNIEVHVLDDKLHFVRYCI